MEEGLFPHQRSLTDLDGLEEERRLCYVGMTRAMQQLYLSWAEQRRLHGVDSYGQASRFVRELPEELLQEVRPRVGVAHPKAVGRFRFEEPAAAGVRLGARVRHGKFGEGVILSVEGNGAQARVQVSFERQGTKWLMVQYANLEPLRSEEHTSELQSQSNLVCRLLLEKKKIKSLTLSFHVTV